jgi:hypothetical protein
VSRRLFIAALLGAALASGAGFAQAPGPAVTLPMPPRTPTLADATPDAHGIRRTVVLRGLDKITGRAIDVNAPIGVPVRFGSLLITARYCYTVPPEEPPETTAFLQIDDTKGGKTAKRMFSGWMFASTPALNGLEHPVYDVWVITCKIEEPASASSATAAAKPAPGKSGSAAAAAPAKPVPAKPPASSAAPAAPKQ